MKINFIHDHKFKFDQNGRCFTDGKFTNELFNRYIFEDNDEVFVIARRIIINKQSHKLNEVNHPKVTFKNVKGINPIQIFIIHFFYNIKILWSVLRIELNIMRLPSFLGLFCCFLCMIFHKKYFVEVVGHTKDSLLDNNSKVGKIVLAHIYSYFTQIAIKNATGAIYVTQNALQKDYPCQGFSNYASNVILKIDNKNNPKISYEINNIPQIGLIGSFNNGYKGIDFAIKLVAHLLTKKKIQLNLHVLGHGSLLEEYKQLAKLLGVEDQIYFDGLLPLEQVPMWLDGMDIYIQPSLTEGLPRSLIEAMSRGLPCIASDVGGIPELLSSSNIFTEFNEKIVGEMLINLLKNQKLRQNIGNANFLKSLDYSFEILENKRKEFWNIARINTGVK